MYHVPSAICWCVDVYGCGEDNRFRFSLHLHNDKKKAVTYRALPNSTLDALDASHQLEYHEALPRRKLALCVSLFPRHTCNFHMFSSCIDKLFVEPYRLLTDLNTNSWSKCKRGDVVLFRNYDDRLGIGLVRQVCLETTSKRGSVACPKH